jgi:hypothetical protein
MLTKQDRKNQYKGIEEVFKRRRDNLNSCMLAVGSWAELARLTGESSSMLVQVAGGAPVRTMGEKFARKIEQRLGLAPGWLDAPH